MATIILTAAVNSLTGAAAAGAAATTSQLFWAGLASTVGAYIDSTVIIPRLLKDRADGGLGSANLQSVDEGAPHRYGIGPETRIPGYLAWQPKELEQREGESGGKGGPANVQYRYYTSILWLFTRIPEGIPSGIREIRKMWFDSKIRYAKGGNQFRNVSTGYKIEEIPIYSSPLYGEQTQIGSYMEVVGLTASAPLGDEDDYYFDEFVIGENVSIAQAADAANNGTFRVITLGRKTNGAPFIRVRNNAVVPANPAHSLTTTVLGLVVAQTTREFDEGLAEGFTVRKGTRSHSPLLGIDQIEGPSASPAFHSYSSMYVDSLALFDFGNRPPNAEALIENDAEPVPLGDAILRILTVYHDLDPSEIDVTRIPTTTVVRGFWWSAPYDAQRVLQPLLIAYDLLWYEAEGKVFFVPRTLADEVTIPTEDLGAFQQNRDNDISTIEVVDETEFRRINECSIRYTDPDSNYQIGDANYRRPDLVEGEVQTIDLTNLTLSKEEARNLAKRVVWQSALFRQEIRFVVGPKWVNLTAGTYVNLTAQGKDWRILVTEIQRGADDRMICTGLQDTGAIEDMPDIAADDSGASGTVGFSYVPPETTIVVLDVPPLLPDHALARSFYLAACASSPVADWRGGNYYDKSPGETSFSIFGSIQTEAIIGILAADMPTGAADFINEAEDYYIDVEIQHGFLTSVSENQLLSGFNQLYIDTGEIIAFETATLITPIPAGSTSGIWRLSGKILRGLGGTEAAIAEHVQYTNVAFIRHQLFRRRIVSASEVGQAVSFKAVSNGGDEEDFLAVTKNPAVGRTALPLPPSHVSGVAINDAQGALPWSIFTFYYDVGDEVKNGTGTTVYSCIAGHGPTANDQPGVGINWQSFWVVVVRPAIEITWNERSRLPLSLFPVGTPETGETNKQYRLEIYRGTSPSAPLVRVVDPLFNSRYTYPNSQRQLDNNLGSFNVKVYQIGSVARSLASTATLPNNA